MNTRHLLIALALAVTSGAVTAQTAYAQSPASQGKTRVQVIEELKQARAEGSMAVSDGEYPCLPTFTSTKTRAQVIAELQQAQAKGEINVGDADYPKLPTFVSTKGRAQVRAELAEYQKHPDPEGLYRGH